MEKNRNGNGLGKLVSLIISTVILTSISYFSYNYLVFCQELKSLTIRDRDCFNKNQLEISMNYRHPFNNLSIVLDGEEMGNKARYDGNRVTFLLENLSSGRHILKVGFNGSFNMVTYMPVEQEVAFEVDTVPPTVKLDYPQGDLVRDKEVYIVGRTEPESCLDIRVNDETFRITAGITGRFYQKVPMEKETNELEIISTDKAGNQGSFKKTLIRDKFPPMIGIRTPYNQQILKQNSAEIVVEVGDTGSGIKDCHIEIDGKSIGGKYDPNIGVLFATVNNLDEGAYTVKAVAEDKAGWKSEMEWEFIVNTQEELGFNTIRPGALGKDIETLQNRLIKLGYLDSTHITGKYDPETETAVLKLKEARNLPLNTLVDKETLLTLNNKIFVYLDEFTLLLVSPDDDLIRQFPIACGSYYYPTPAGEYFIKEKVYHPTWYPPDSPWARGSKPIPPGPGNPLGTRWLGLSGGGIGIHGTPNSWSIGTPASHGCIRMYISDVEELFELVNTGTPVFIYYSRPSAHQKYNLKKGVPKLVE